MNIFEFGMQMEKDGEAYYRNLAEKTGNKGLKSIFTMLADAEVGHHSAMKAMAENTNPEMYEAKLLADVKNVFVQMKDEQRDLDLDASQIDLYKTAQETEKKAEAFFREQSEAAESSAQKEIFTKLADEEKEHFVLLENLIEFVSRPAEWLENAEWSHLDSY